MAREEPPKEFDAVIKFGGGLNTRGSEDAIDPRECADGQNFDLDVDNALFRRRKAFDLIATAPNGAQVRGGAQLAKVDGTLSTLVQAGGAVYEWDGGSTFTSVGTVSTSAKLRGPLSANFTLDDTVIITDLNKVENVKEWDGTTFQDIQHGLGSDFRAKYCIVEDERAFYGNVATSTDTPHLLVGSARGDYDSLSVSDRPSSALSEEDPFFLPMPDLKPVNGLVGALGRIVFSTLRGRVYQLSGATAKDFVVDQFYPDSGAAGEEAFLYVGNDVAYGRPGRIESLFATTNLGDVQTDDLTRKIANLVTEVDDWQAAYSSRTQKIYFFNRDQSRVFVYHKPFLDETVRRIAARQDSSSLSPWSIWRTQHSMGFQTQAVMTMRRPTDGLEVTYMGGPNGEIFQLEGSGGQDGGTADIAAERLSAIVAPPSNMRISGVEGYVSYRKSFPATLTLTFQFGGDSLKDETITFSLPAAENLPVYGGNLYYSNDVYYSAPFKGRFARQRFSPAGQANQIQVKASIEGAADFSIQEIGLRFTAS